MVKYTSGNELHHRAPADGSYQRAYWDRSVNLECHYCGSNDVVTDISGSLLVITCLAGCGNWWQGAVGEVFLKHFSGEPYFDLPEQFDRVK